MSQVEKLKELLFQPESEAIADLSRRLEAVFERAGTEARFEASVSRTIDGALRTAEVEKHSETAAAIAPLVVRTVKTEIRNSTDELVEALYPATGRMVKAYVASAIKELTESINRRLEENPVMLRLSALTSGQSAAELALADSQRLKIEDVFLIRRATGELLGRWPELPGGTNLDHVFGGVLTAINEFTAEAFKSQGSSLREIDLGDTRVYLRVSPAYLRAARCSGTETAAAEQIFDDEFLALVERHRPLLEASRDGPVADRSFEPMLQDLSARLGSRLAEIEPGRATIRRGIRPLTLLAILLGLPLLAWFGWSAYQSWNEARIVSTVRSVLTSTPELKGYPSKVVVSDGGRAVTVSGLTPSPSVEAGVMKRLRAELPGIDVRDDMNSVPVGADVGPMIASIRQDQAAFEAEVKSALERRNRERAASNLGRAAATIEAAAPILDPDQARNLSRFSTEARALASSLDATAGDEGRVAAAIVQARSLEAAVLAAARATLDIEVARPATDAAKADLAEATERVAVAAGVLAERGAMKRRLSRETSALRSEIVALAAPRITPREELAAFARNHAVFFSEGTAFRDPVAVERVLNQLAGLIARDTSVVRIVGYTDDAGTPLLNSNLAQARADTVAAALTARGVPANRIVTLRRISTENNLSPVTGTRSANRRVQFELGFVGEGAD